MLHYYTLFGENPDAEMLLDVLGLKRDDFYRYRNCYLEDDKIAVLTRGGASHRACYCIREGGTHKVYCAVPRQAKVRQHPLYLYDEDSEYDVTYAVFYFRVPLLSPQAIGEIGKLPEDAPTISEMLHEDRGDY